MQRYFFTKTPQLRTSGMSFSLTQEGNPAWGDIVTGLLGEKMVAQITTRGVCVAFLDRNGPDFHFGQNNIFSNKWSHPSHPMLHEQVEAYRGFLSYADEYRHNDHAAREIRRVENEAMMERMRMMLSATVNESLNRHGLLQNTTTFRNYDFDGDVLERAAMPFVLPAYETMAQRYLHARHGTTTNERSTRNDTRIRNRADVRDEVRNHEMTRGGYRSHREVRGQAAVQAENVPNALRSLLSRATEVPQPGPVEMYGASIETNWDQQPITMQPSTGTITGRISNNSPQRVRRLAATHEDILSNRELRWDVTQVRDEFIVNVRTT